MDNYKIVEVKII